MEIRFVGAFIDAGVSWKVMRKAHAAAKAKLFTEHPFCTHQFATDGRNILHQEAQLSGDKLLFDITDNQQEFERLISPFLKELEIDHGGMRWWPLGKQRLVVVDPVRNMGQPTVNRSGVPTRVLAQSVRTNGCVESVARWYEVTHDEVRDAVAFEQQIAA